MEAKEFGRFIAGMRKEKKMTQAELAEKIHVDRKSTRLNSSHIEESRMPSSA